jgi:hypothetical protein
MDGWMDLNESLIQHRMIMLQSKWQKRSGLQLPYLFVLQYLDRVWVQSLPEQPMLERYPMGGKVVRDHLRVHLRKLVHQ